MYTDGNRSSLLNKEETKQWGTAHLRMKNIQSLNSSETKDHKISKTQVYISLFKHGSRYWSSEELHWKATKHFNSNDATWSKKSASHCICVPNNKSARSYVIPTIILPYQTCTLQFVFQNHFVLCQSDENVLQSHSCPKNTPVFPLFFFLRDSLFLEHQTETN